MVQRAAQGWTQNRVQDGSHSHNLQQVPSWCDWVWCGAPTLYRSHKIFFGFFVWFCSRSKKRIHSSKFEKHRTHMLCSNKVPPALPAVTQFPSLHANVIFFSCDISHVSEQTHVHNSPFYTAGHTRHTGLRLLLLFHPSSASRQAHPKVYQCMNAPQVSLVDLYWWTCQAVAKSCAITKQHFKLYFREFLCEGRKLTVLPNNNEVNNLITNNFSQKLNRTIATGELTCTMPKCVWQYSKYLLASFCKMWQRSKGLVVNIFQSNI